MKKNSLQEGAQAPSSGKRTSRALRDRQASQPIMLDRVRALAVAGLTLPEIAARLHCPPESLAQPEAIAAIQQARLSGYLMVRNKLLSRALQGSLSAIRFLLEQDAEVRAEADLQDVAKPLEELQKEHQAALAAGQHRMARKLERRLNNLKELQRWLEITLVDLLKAKPGGRPRRLNRWQRVLCAMQQRRESMTPAELQMQLREIEEALQIEANTNQEWEERITRIEKKLREKYELRDADPKKSL